jgi:hypothetical protein
MKLSIIRFIFGIVYLVLILLIGKYLSTKYLDLKGVASVVFGILFFLLVYPIFLFGLSMLLHTNMNLVLVLIPLILIVTVLGKNMLYFSFNTKEILVLFFALIIFVIYFLNYSGPFTGYWDTYIASPSIIMTGHKINFIDLDSNQVYNYNLTNKLPNDLINENSYGIISKDQRLGTGIIFSIPYLFFGMLGFPIFNSLLISLSFLLFYYTLKRHMKQNFISLAISLFLFTNNYFVTVTSLNPNLVGFFFVIMIIFLVLRPKINWIALGFVFGAFGSIRNVAIIFSIPLAYVLFREKKVFKNITLFVLSVIVLISPILFWNYYAFGNPFIHSSQYFGFEGFRPVFDHFFFGTKFSLNGLLNFPFSLEIVRTPHFSFPVFLFLPLLLIRIFGGFSILVIYGLFNEIPNIKKYFLLLWIIPMLVLLSFQENWEVAKTSFILLILPVFFLFLADGVLKIKSKIPNLKKFLSLLVISIVVFIFLINSYHLNYYVDERWYERFPKAKLNAYFEYEPLAYPDEFKFFQTMDSTEEIDSFRQNLTSPKIFPKLFGINMLLKHTSPIDFESNYLEPNALIIWKYIYVQNE